MRNVFVTGCSGFLGGHLCKALVDRGCNVVGLVRDLKPYSPNYEDVMHEITEVNGDLTDIAVLGRALSEYEVDTVFHLAAQTQVSVAVQNPVATLEANVRGTWNVLEACRTQNVKRVVVASSDKAYSDGQTPYSESQQVSWGGPYETSKACADMIAHSYSRTYSMGVAVTRCGNLYGEGHINWSTLIPGTIARVYRGERPVIHNDGQSKRDFLYVGDAVDAYLKLAASDLTGAYNFGTQRPTAVIDVMRTILRLMGSSSEPEIHNKPTTDIKDQWLRCDRARRELAWSAKVSLEEGLKKVIPWYRQFLGE